MFSIVDYLSACEFAASSYFNTESCQPGCCQWVNGTHRARSKGLIMPNARKILIGDDDTELRDTLMEHLSLHDEFDVTEVDTGARGAGAAKANAPDLVL